MNELISYLIFTEPVDEVINYVYVFKSKAKFQFVGGQKQARIHCFTGFPPAIVEQPS